MSRRRYGRGFVLGKFMPLHAGHVRLVDAAASACDELVILVCTSPDEPLPERLRYDWAREVWPRHRVVHVSEGQPSYPHEHPDFEAIWTELLRRRLPQGVDVFFSGEPYGDDVARWLGIEHVLVDRDRASPGLSATGVRRDPWGHWEALPPPVRAHYVVRVALVGPESTGKSTLARRLADRFRTVDVQEYGREHTRHMRPVSREIVPDDFAAIAREHAARIEAAARRADRILFSDTDVLTTALWAEIYLGSCPPEVRAAADAQRVDLHLLCAPDIAWEDDGTREFESLRPTHFRRLKDELDRRRAPYVVVRGEGEARLAAAAAGVEAFLAQARAAAADSGGLAS